VKKFINSVDTMPAEGLDGFAAAHADIVALGAERKFVRRRTPNLNKVALISGGGSGHEPLHAGFVGHGMLDAACPGQVFTSPTPDQIVEAATAVGGKAGVLFIVKNYTGDCMNFEMAAELCDGATATVITNDDVAVEKSTHSAGRRGVAGTLVVEKIVGAAAEKGMDLNACAQLGTEVNARTGSMGVALTSCTVPAAGSPTFALADDEMEMGVGIHGEPGRARIKLASAEAIADQMLTAILNDRGNPNAGDVLLLVNGFGGTPTIELYLMYNVARRILEKRGLTVTRSLVGSYVTSLEMAGCSITVTQLDDKLTALWGDRVHVRVALVICGLFLDEILAALNLIVLRLRAMRGRIWTPPDCNRLTGSSATVTTADVNPAS
jgi:phosphoenolpyruvate---glycerone phosphotransferase subunit DhaK